jgi:hypothetical protein
MVGMSQADPTPNPPKPAPDSEWVTNRPSDSDLRYALSGSSETPPELDPNILTEDGGEVVLYGSQSPSPGPNQKTSTRGEAPTSSASSGSETRQRGEDDGELTHARGEAHSNSDTGTFSRGENDDDLRPFAFGLDPLSTETKRDRGDADFNAVVAFDSMHDDQGDARRITPLGLIAARQQAVSKR